jgi:two-component system sensor histidine kinase MtrB
VSGWLRLGLRARITAIYALGALLVSSTVAVVGFALVQRELLQDAEEAARAQVYVNARFVRSALQNQTPEAIEAALAEQIDVAPGEEDATPTLNLDDVLGGILNRNNARDLLIIQGQARSSLGLQEREVSPDVRAIVAEGGAAQQRTVVGDQPRLTVGVHIAQLDAGYFEVSSLQPLQDTLLSLRNTLVAVAIGAGLAGAALGYYSTRSALQPVVRVARAAQAISSGDFGTRLDPSGDPDLAPLTASFNDMVGALESRIERDERFASDVSHELRSPLMTLSASIGVLEHRRDELSPEAVQAVDLLGKDLRRFTGLVEDLLEISRIDGGGIAPDSSPIVLAEFLSFAVRQSRTPEVPIVVDDEQRATVVVADKRRLAQVIQNLVDNAAKYGGGATAVGFTASDDAVQIFVEDRGPGVPTADRERIFDRFTRAGADAGRREVAKGVGLGLSLVAEHVRLHQGRVWVTDRLDGEPGARFIVELPIGDVSVFDEELAT